MGFKPDYKYGWIWVEEPSTTAIPNIYQNIYYTGNNLDTPKGWMCPRCGQINAPWKPTCDCRK